MVVKISIILPAYNVEKYISKTLDSIFDQLFRDFELIIIDDGSKDNTLNIIQNKMFETDIPIKLISQQNQGVSFSRNRGIEISSGKYIVFIDGDDYINSDFLEKMYSTAEHNNADAVVCGYDTVDILGNVLKIRKMPKKKIVSGFDILKSIFDGKITVCVSNILYKKEVISKNNLQYTDKCTHNEDGEFIYKTLLHSERVGIVNNILFHYLQRSKSAVTSGSLERLNSLYASKRIELYFKNNATPQLYELYSKKRMPSELTYLILRLAYNNQNTNEIVELTKNEELRKYLKTFKVGYSIWDINIYIASKMILYCPKLAFRVYKRLYNLNLSP